MKTRLALVLALLLTASSARATELPDNVVTTTAWDIVTHIFPGNNNYGSPASLLKLYGTFHATTKCGSFVALLLKRAYPALLANGVDRIQEMTGSTTPNAGLWYDAIDDEASYGGYWLDKDTTWPWANGVILAAKYDGGDNTGHVMVSDGEWYQAYDGWNISNTVKYDLWIFDSTTAVHEEDTRTGAEWGGENDRGIGYGRMRVYIDSQTGALVAWMWGWEDGNIYWAGAPRTCPIPPPQDDDDPTCSNRPMVVGRLVTPFVLSL